MTCIIAPSILAADFTQLGDAISLLDRSKADWIHIDVMDGRFVPNISFGFPIIEAIRPLTSKVFDVHLMIEQPERYIEAFAKAGADVLTVHYEACPHLYRTLEAIRQAGMKAGVAINPHTPVEALRHVLPIADLALVMSVNPGYGGQKFLPLSFEKVAQLKELCHTTDSKTLIEVDGGVGPNNAQFFKAAGANVLVAGSSVFSASDPLAVIEQMLTD